jgi:hypothetical protein
MCRAGPKDRCCDDSTVCRTNIQPRGECLRFLRSLAGTWECPAGDSVVIIPVSSQIPCKQGILWENHDFRHPESTQINRRRPNSGVLPPSPPSASDRAFSPSRSAPRQSWGLTPIFLAAATSRSQVPASRSTPFRNRSALLVRSGVPGVTTGSSGEIGGDAST